jgi:hypothetical protein
MDSRKFPRRKKHMGTKLSAIKSYARGKLIRPARHVWDEWTLRRSVETLRKSDLPDLNLLKRMRRAWGNEGFSADVTYLRELAKRVVTCRGPILECGTGLTTIIAGILADKRKLQVWCLEQESAWAEVIERTLAKHRIRNVHVMYAPLKICGDYVWYDIETLELPKDFELVLCDGPAVFERGSVIDSRWRYGLLPTLKNRSITVHNILLDDVDDAHAEKVLALWESEFHTSQRVVHSADGDLAVIHCSDRKAGGEPARHA